MEASDAKVITIANYFESSAMSFILFCDESKEAKIPSRSVPRA